MEKKLHQLFERLAEVEEVLGNPLVYEDQKKFRALTQEHAYLTQLKSAWEKQKQLKKQVTDNQELLKSEKEFEFSEIVREDTAELEKQIQQLQLEIENLLVLPDPNDNKPTIVELRAGTGGD